MDSQDSVRDATGYAAADPRINIGAPVAPCSRLIDDRHGQLSIFIVLGEEAPLHERCLYHPKIIWADADDFRAQIRRGFRGPISSMASAL